MSRKGSGPLFICFCQSRQTSLLLYDASPNTDVHKGDIRPTCTSFCIYTQFLNIVPPHALIKLRRRLMFVTIELFLKRNDYGSGDIRYSPAFSWMSVVAEAGCSSTLLRRLNEPVLRAMVSYDRNNFTARETRGRGTLGSARNCLGLPSMTRPGQDMALSHALIKAPAGNLVPDSRGPMYRLLHIDGVN